jgi:hypothetical protein
MSASINTSTGLPDIPSLPPIEIPDTAIFRASLDHHLPTLDEEAHLSPHTFTSLSPSSHRQPAGSSNDTPLSSPTRISPLTPNLRKSFSVDSFSRQSRLSPVSVMGRQHKAITAATAADDLRGPSPPWRPQGVDAPQVSCFPRNPSFPLSIRSRGASVSTIGDEDSQSIPEESDVELARDTPQSSTGARRTVLKIKDKLRPTLPPELPLSSKLHGAIPAAPAIITGSSNDSTPRPPSATVATFSHRPAPKAGPSGQWSSEDITVAGSASNNSSPCTGCALQSVSFLPLASLTPSDLTT